MKKPILSIIFALATLTANAQSHTATLGNNTAKKERVLRVPSNAALKRLNVPKDDKPLFNPEGEEEGYIMAYTDNNGFYEQDYTNGKVYVRKSADGSTYYFNGLTPGGNRSYRGADESWLVGKKEGDEIVVKAGQVLVENQAKKLYFEVVHADEWGNVTSFEQEARLKIGSQGELTTKDGDIFAIYEDADNEEDAGFFGFFYNMELKPMGELVRWEFPQGSTPQTYVLSGEDAYEEKVSRFVKLAFSGDKFYISGLSSMSPDEVYEGTCTATTATIPSFQIVKDADLFYYRIAPVTVDSEGTPAYQNTIDFSMSADRKEFTMTPADAYLCETTYDLNGFVTTLKNVTLKYYAGDHAAKPAMPQIDYWEEYNDAIVFSIPTEDVNGEYINPDKLAYRIYADGNRYTFTTADYERLTEDMDEIPFGFTDNFDIANNGTQKIVYFHNLNAENIGVESVYTVGDVTTVSDRVVYDIATGTGITDKAAAQQPAASAYYSLEGMRLNTPRKGSIVLKQSIMADGSKKVEKYVVK